MLASRNAAIDFCFGNSRKRLPQFGQSLAQRVAQPALGRIIRRQQEHRQHEDDEPDAGQRTGDAVALMGDGIETEQRREAEQRAAGLGIGGEKAEHQDQAEDAADIAGGPAGAGQSPDLVRRHQRRHHRIVEDGGEFDADGRDRHRRAAAAESRWDRRACRTTSGRSRSPAARRTPRSTACGGRWHPRSRPVPATSARSAARPPRWQSPTATARWRDRRATWVAK